jgi:cytoskeletal protein RodZ
MAPRKTSRPRVSGRSTAVVLWLMITLVFLPIVAIHGIAALLASREIAAREQEALQQTASVQPSPADATVLHR